jgi:hypothetical protein
MSEQYNLTSFYCREGEYSLRSTAKSLNKIPLSLVFKVQYNPIIINTPSLCSGISVQGITQQ